MDKTTLTPKQLRCLRFFANGETRVPRVQDIEAFFELDSMGLISEYFDGNENTNVGYITKKGLSVLKEARDD